MKTGVFAKRKPVMMTAIVALAFCAQAVYAQSDSPTKKASAGRFLTDVDRFVSVTDWADIPLQSWFSYINLSHGELGGDYNNSWEIGFAKKLKTVYLGAGFQGKFWNGSSGWGAVTDNHDTANPGFTGPTVDLSNPFGTGGDLEVAYPTGMSPPDGVKANADNVFNFLVGFSNGSALKFKLTEKNVFTRIEGPIVIDDDGATRKGYARKLNGTITPAVEYGFSKDIEVGAFKVRPKAALDLAIAFNESELQDGDSTVLANFTQNTMTPLLTLDTGANSFFIWEGGSLGVGLANKIGFKYQDTTRSGTPAESEQGQDAKVSDWLEVFTPYARFTQQINPAFTVKAALDIPLSIEAGGYLGIYDAQVKDASGNNGAASLSGSDSAGGAFPRLRLGAQYAFKDGKLADKLALNIGVTVYLPALAYTDAHIERDGNGDIDYVTENYKWTWTTKDVLQDLSLGATFKFGGHAALDFWTNITLSGNNTLNDNQVWNSLLNWGGILFSLTY